jgi:hypothetical protein
MRIPNEKDRSITELLERWVALDERERQISASKISFTQAQILRAYGERMASAAVREHDARRIFFGLIALGLDGWSYDWRENVMILALLYDSAQRIDANPVEVITKAASLLAPSASVQMQHFLSRSAHDQSIQAMGYENGRDVDGFRYRRNW